MQEININIFLKEEKKNEFKRNCTKNLSIVRKEKLGEFARNNYRKKLKKDNFYKSLILGYL